MTEFLGTYATATSTLPRTASAKDLFDLAARTRRSSNQLRLAIADWVFRAGNNPIQIAYSARGTVEAEGIEPGSAMNLGSLSPPRPPTPPAQTS
jgi:hypothetical protein